MVCYIFPNLFKKGQVKKEIKLWNLACTIGKLFGGTVPPNGKLFGGTVMPNIFLIFQIIKIAAMIIV